jgi:YidC/Oxa1 family membrane protein insertase
MDQKRLLLAIVLSAVILFGWTYLFPPTNPQQNANSNQIASDATPTPAPTAAQPTQAEQQQQSAPVAASPDTVPQRTVIVSTPLYKVELDSRGAVVKAG